MTDGKQSAFRGALPWVGSGAAGGILVLLVSELITIVVAGHARDEQQRWGG